MSEIVLSDDKVLEMRMAGNSYGSIAKALGLERAHEACHAFRRALLRRPAAEQVELREAEIHRLNRLDARLRDQSGITEDELARRLLVLDRLRESLG